MVGLEWQVGELVFWRLWEGDYLKIGWVSFLVFVMVCLARYLL